MAKTAAECTTMADIRENIDRVDRELMALFAERWSFIGRAAEIKAGLGLPADVPERVRQVRRGERRELAVALLEERPVSHLRRQGAPFA